jgi:pteridine reductase
MEKVAVVTGGAQRIGREIVRHLHGAGYTVVLHYRSSDAAAQALTRQLNDIRPASCLPLRADLADLADLGALAQSVADRCDGIDLLVNNASGFSPTPIESCTEAAFDAMLNANLKGPYFLIQSFLPLLRARSGSIVNIIDVHVDFPLRDYNVYGAAKAGLAALTRSLALELGPDIRANGVSPGAILWPEGDSDAYDEATRERTVARTPLQRLGEPADIARTVLFLAQQAPFINGQIIAVDGGRTLAL